MGPRRAVVTGASRGIGAGVAQRLAEAGYDLVLTARDSGAARSTLSSVRASARPHARIEWRPADFSRMDEVAALGRAITASGPPPTLLVHCAATVPARDTRTPDGFETQWAVNHLAPFLLTALVPVGSGSDGATGRIVTVASQLHRGAALHPPTPPFVSEPYERQQRYCDTKLANVLFARALARRIDPGVAVSVSLHPGAAGTGLLHDLEGTRRVDRVLNRAILAVKRESPWGLDDCVEQVSRLCVRPLAADAAGTYWEQGAVVEPSAEALDDALGEWLWKVSEEAVAAWLRGA